MEYIGYILLWFANIYSIREFYKTVRNIERKHFIYNSEEHSMEHFNYLLVYNFTLVLVWVHLLDIISLNFVLSFWAISTVILVNHIRKERLEWRNIK
jgi:hypothetical protein